MAKRLKSPDKVDKSALFPGDQIEFKITYEVEVEPGIRAWVGYGNVSQVQPDETGEKADARVKRHVKSEVQKRAREAVEEA